MLIFLCQGGESTITVYAPAGSQITASGGGESWSGSIPSGASSVSFNVHTIASWSVSCTYQSREISKTVSITSFGASESVSFSYATLTVNTYPGASVTISKSGSSSQNKTATGGSALFYLTEEEFDSLTPWTASCSYTSGSTWSNSGTKFITAATSYSLTVSLSVPVFSFSWSGGSASFTTDSPTSSTSQYYYYRNGANWEFYAKVNGTLNFGNNTVVDLFLLGGGNAGGSGSVSVSREWDYSQSRWIYWASSATGGSGGLGGKRKKYENITMSGSSTVTVGSAGGNNSAIGSYSSGDSGYSQSGASANGGYCFHDSNAIGIDGNNYLVGAGGGKGAGALRNGGKTNRTLGGSRNGGDGGDAAASGGSDWSDSGSSGNYWGAGGGGGGAWGNDNRNYDEASRGGSSAGGSGYKGFVAVRNKR